MLADRGEEQAGHADVGAVLGPAGHGGMEAGEVALEHGPADAVRAGDAAGVQEGSEPGQDAQRPDTAGFQPEAGAQPPSDPAFSQVLELLLGDPGEVQDIPALEAEAVHLPGVAGILGVPAAALGQVGDLPAGPGQQRDRVALLLPERIPPFLLGPVQQRGRPAGGQEPDHDHHDERRGLARPLVAPPLERVLNLQLQLRGQAVHEDALIDGDRVGIEIPGGEAARFGPAVDFPRGTVALAEPDITLGPQAAEPDQAILLALWRYGRGDAGQPFIGVRVSGAFPGRAVARAHSPAADAAPAAGCTAAGQGFLPVPAGARRRGERVQVRPALSGPPVVVSGA